MSGGGDSVALLHMFASWAGRESGAAPVVLTVDHGLRAESAAEAELTVGWARALGLSTHILRWHGCKPEANVEDKARAARYRLLGAWCIKNGVRNLFLAHTEDDLAETFLLRLGRGSGVDGLSAMRARAPLPCPGFEGVQVVRPLLGISRAQLRAYLPAKGASWLEDPMNQDERFARSRIRKAMPALEAAGISPTRIAQAAQHLVRAREALDAATEEFLCRHARFEGDFALLDGAALARLPREIGLRALCAVLMRVGECVYRPRFERLEALYDTVVPGEFAARTLLGCRVGRAPKAARAAFGPPTLLIAREQPRRSTTGPTRQPAIKTAHGLEAETA